SLFALVVLIRFLDIWRQFIAFSHSEEANTGLRNCKQTRARAGGEKSGWMAGWLAEVSQYGLDIANRLPSAPMTQTHTHTHRDFVFQIFPPPHPSLSHLITAILLHHHRLRRGGGRRSEREMEPNSGVYAQCSTFTPLTGG